MARLEGVPETQASLLTRQVYRGVRRKVGKLSEPLTIKAHSPSLMWADTLFEISLLRAHSLDPGLKGLASLKVAGLVGCVF